MRELGGQDAPDGGDNGADGVPGPADDARQPRYEVVRDAAAREASALEYRQRVAARDAAYEAGDARAQDAQASQDSWPPPSADQDRVRQLYREYLADRTSADRQSHRDQGVNTVGAKPGESPGELSGLPPAGDELAEMESSKKSRFSELFGEAEKEENLDGLHDAAEEYSSTVQRWLSARPPEGHAEQHVPTHHPYVTPWGPDHGVEGGDAAGAVLMAGILTVHMARWIDDKLRHGKGDHDDGNR
jgi:hypothetical protein